MEVETLAFNSIGFHAALMLNKLRSQRQITDDQAADDGDRGKREEESEEIRAKLTLIDKRLSLLRERVEPSAAGRERDGN